MIVIRSAPDRTGRTGTHPQQSLLEKWPQETSFDIATYNISERVGQVRVTSQTLRTEFHSVSTRPKLWNGDVLRFRRNLMGCTRAIVNAEARIYRLP